MYLRSCALCSQSSLTLACFPQIEKLFTVICQIADVLVSQYFKVAFNLNDIIILINACLDYSFALSLLTIVNLSLSAFASSNAMRH